MSACATCNRPDELVAVLGCPMFECPRVAGDQPAPLFFGQNRNAKAVVTPPELHERRPC